MIEGALWETHCRAMERHLPYATQYYFLPDAGECIPFYPQPVIYQPSRDKRPSYIAWCWLYSEMVHLSADSHPSK